MALYYRERTWAPETTVPYQVQLDFEDHLIYAHTDTNELIRLPQGVTRIPSSHSKNARKAVLISAGGSGYDGPTDDDGLVPADNEEAVLSWLAGQGFAEGDLRSEISINKGVKCPMA